MNIRTVERRCDICIEEQCGGKRDCNCDICQVKDKCPKILRPTIRITNRCTQECSHCCFESSPKSDTNMTVEKAKEIAKFLEANQIHDLNMMGGEFFCNPDWLEVLMELGLPDHIIYFRLVSNSDWYKNDTVKQGLLSLRDALGPKFHMSLSKDRWHTNVGVEEAEKWLVENNILTIVANKSNTKQESIVPVGRAEWGFWGFFDTIQNQCAGDEEHYTFLIDEEGLIYKCNFGVWPYAKVNEYLEGGFRERFKSYNQKFYKIFIPNCKACYRSAKRFETEEESKDQIRYDRLVVKRGY